MHYFLLVLLFIEQAWFAMLYYCSFGNKQLKPFMVGSALFIADISAKSFFFPPNHLTTPFLIINIISNIIAFYILIRYKRLSPYSLMGLISVVEAAGLLARAIV